MAEYDAVLVGSGVNSLACAALLAQGGWRVCVLERNEWLGGAIRTAELTEPGYLHDVFSAWHPLWVAGAAHAQLGDELAARGLEYLDTELPTATAFPDGEAAFLLRDAEGNARYGQDASFVKLREVVLSWELPAGFRQRAFRGGVSQARLELSGRNLVTWSKYAGVDPEVSNFGSQHISRFIDLAPFPPRPARSKASTCATWTTSAS